MVYCKLIISEIKMNIKSMISYRTNIISEVIVILSLYIGLIFFNSGSSLNISYGSQSDSKTLLLTGYLFWSMACTALGVSSSNITGESQRGTLELKLMSISPYPILLLGNLISSIILETVELSIIILVSLLVFKIRFTFSISYIFILIITVIGMYAIGLILGGIAIVNKQISKLVYIFQILLLLFTDVISVNNNLGLLRKLIPLTYGTDLARKSISNIYINNSEWIKFVSINLIWVVIGSLIFYSFENKARRNGSLSHY